MTPKNSSVQNQQAKSAHPDNKVKIETQGPVQIKSVEQFERYLSDDKPVIVDFWASWCQPCRLMAPMFDKIAQDFTGEIHFLKINVEEVDALAAAFKIRSIPTLLSLHGKEVIDVRVGLVDQAGLAKLAKEALAYVRGETLTQRIKNLFQGVKKQTEAVN